MILDTYKAATQDQINAGMNWYRDAHDLASGLSRDIGRGAGVIAALSPNTSWKRNIELAQKAFHDGRATGTFGNSCKKANRILAYEHPLTVLGGKKVINFYHCIVNPWQNKYVCIDRHAYDIAVGIGSGDRKRSELERKGEYERIADLYRAAADEIGIYASQLQAITWLVWRDKYVHSMYL